MGFYGSIDKKMQKKDDFYLIVMLTPMSKNIVVDRPSIAYRQSALS